MDKLSIMHYFFPSHPLPLSLRPVKANLTTEVKLKALHFRNESNPKVAIWNINRLSNGLSEEAEHQKRMVLTFLNGSSKGIAIFAKAP